MTNRRNFIKQMMDASTLVLGCKLLHFCLKTDNTSAQHEDGDAYATPHAMKGRMINESSDCVMPIWLLANKNGGICCLNLRLCGELQGKTLLPLSSHTL